MCINVSVLWDITEQAIYGENVNSTQIRKSSGFQGFSSYIPLMFHKFF